MIAVILMYKRLRNLREDNDLTQKEIAEMLHIHQTTYSSYELGLVEIPLNALKKLCKFYKVSTDYILELTDDKSVK